MRRELRIECVEIGGDAGEQLRLKLLARREKRRKRMLDWRVHRKVGVGDHLEATNSVALELGRSGKSDPSAFHLWKAAKFRHAAKSEGEGRML